MATKTTPVDPRDRALALVEQAQEVLRELEGSAGSDPRYTVLYGVTSAWDTEGTEPVFLATYDLIEGLLLGGGRGLYGRFAADVVKIVEHFGLLYGLINAEEPSEEDVIAAREIRAALEDLSKIVHAISATPLLGDGSR